MTDVREAILARLTTVAAAVGAFATAGRNIADLPEEALPALVVMDGDEEVDQGDRGRGRPALRPRIVTMSPSVHLVLARPPAEIGPAASALRLAVIAAVLGDATLLALTKDGTGIEYDGAAFGLFDLGRSQVAEVGLSFSFTYLLLPADLSS